MKYKVHRFPVMMDEDHKRLEEFLNNLGGDIVSIIPNFRKTSLFQIFGVTGKTDFLLIVEKTLKTAKV